MLDNATIERLKAMKMNAFAAELERQLEDSESYSQLGFEERLGLLVDSEWNRRQNNDIVNNSWHIFLKHSHTYAVISKEL